MSRTMRELVEERSAEIVGRAAEKAALLGTLEEGGQLVVFVHGIAGVGKSTLLEAFAGEARRRGATVVRIDCRSIEPTERGFLDGLGGAVGGAPASAEEAGGAPCGARLSASCSCSTRTRSSACSTAGCARSSRRRCATTRGSSWRAASLPSPAGTPRRAGASSCSASGSETSPTARPRSCWRDPASTPATRCRVNRLARGHPLSLELAAAAVRARPDVELEDIALQAILEELTGLYLDGLDDPTREALDAASVVRRITLSLLEAMLPERGAAGRLRTPARSPVRPARTRRTRRSRHDPRSGRARPARLRSRSRIGAIGAAAWRKLRSELPTVPPAGLWRYTADMLYLIEQPGRARGVLPHGRAHVYSVEHGDARRRSGGRGDRAPSRAGSGCRASALVVGRGARRLQRRTRSQRGVVVGLSLLFEPDRVSYGAIEADPVARSWRDHLRRDPVPRGQRVLFSRRWLSARRGRASRRACRRPAGSTSSASTWSSGPELRRIYTTVRDLATYAPILTPLGFAPLADAVATGWRHLPLRACSTSVRRRSTAGWRRSRRASC